MEFWITKKSIGTKGMFHYEVWTDQQQARIGERKSPRTYIGCGIVVNGGTVHPHYFSIRNWFGRKDLIGKGESSRYLGKPGSFVALLKEEDEQTQSTVSGEVSG